MRKSPINHLATAVVATSVWVIAVVWGAAYLGDAIPFVDVTPEEFQWMYRVIMMGLAAMVIAQTSYWYVYGARESTTTELAKAKRLWVIFWFVQLLLSGIAVAAIALLFLGELFEPVHYAVMYALAALQTWITFWVTTIFVSPRPVQYVPWGKG